MTFLILWLSIDVVNGVNLGCGGGGWWCNMLLIFIGGGGSGALDGENCKFTFADHECRFVFKLGDLLIILEPLSLVVLSFIDCPFHYL